MIELIRTDEGNHLLITQQKNFDSPERKFEVALPFYGKTGKSFIRVTESGSTSTLDTDSDNGLSLYHWCNAETAFIEDYAPCSPAEWNQAITEMIDTLQSNMVTPGFPSVEKLMKNIAIICEDFRTRNVREVV